MYKIIFIDEYQDDIDDFLDYIDEKDTNNKFEIISLLPLNNIEDMVNKIIDLDSDAIVTDFMLNEYKDSIKYNVPYTGINLVNKIKNIKNSFPCFVMTSYDEDAIKTSYDVNIVYIKGILHGEEQKTSAGSNFLERIENQIKHYKNRIKIAEQELQALIEKSNEKTLDSKEEERVIELDNFLEKTIHKDYAIPSQLKTYQGLDDLHKLISNTDKLIEQLQAENGK
jgi:hypothetical protein